MRSEPPREADDAPPPRAPTPHSHRGDLLFGLALAAALYAVAMGALRLTSTPAATASPVRVSVPTP